MAVDERTLLVDYDGMDEVLSHIREMHDQATEMRDLLQRHTDELQGGLWKGKGATAYYKEYNDIIKPALDRLVQGTEEAQATIKKMKGETQSLEEQIASAWKEMISLVPGG